MPKVSANGIELYYELHEPGAPARPVVVLNNGIIMNAATSWNLQVRALAARHRLLLYDCRGQGRSDHPDEPHSMDQHADDLAALLEALGVEHAHIGGISYGGEVAQAFALKYPARTRSLILADTVSEVGPELAIVVGGWIAAAQSGDSDTFFDATVHWNFSPAFIAANPALMADARQRYARLDFAAVVRLCECFVTTVAFTERLGEIQAPTCILFGEHDRLKGRHYAEILHHHIRHSEFHAVLGAGHATCWEQPEAFNTILLGFLAKHAGEE